MYRVLANNFIKTMKEGTENKQNRKKYKKKHEAAPTKVFVESTKNEVDFTLSTTAPRQVRTHFVVVRCFV